MLLSMFLQVLRPSFANGPGLTSNWPGLTSDNGLGLTDVAGLPTRACGCTLLAARGDLAVIAHRVALPVAGIALSVAVIAHRVAVIAARAPVRATR